MTEEYIQGPNGPVDVTPHDGGHIGWYCSDCQRWTIEETMPPSKLCVECVKKSQPSVPELFLKAFE